MKRIYPDFIKKHFRENQQMLFLVGPRQVGKTTITELVRTEYKEAVYLSWDMVKDRQQMLEGQDFIESIFPSSVLREQKPLVIFDEIHHYKDWKNYLKGFFDLYKYKFNILVIGSARLDVYQAGGDSMMGRYFQWQVHPLSVRECAQMEERSVGQDIRSPCSLPGHKLHHLYQYGGFPESFLKARQRCSEDIRVSSRIEAMDQLQVLAAALQEHVGQLLNRSHLSRKAQVSVSTLSRWIGVLERHFFCYTIKPWSKNITRSVIKEPKIYLYDWSAIDDPGAKFENFVASHLLKAVSLWQDLGRGRYGLYFVRNKDKREVDFLVTKNDQPWFLVEAKCSFQGGISPHLGYFQEQLQCPHAFQVVWQMDYVDKDCFECHEPTIVPASTFLSQLV